MKALKGRLKDRINFFESKKSETISLSDQNPFYDC